ncbi:E3 ubiquitin-protein ligase UBR2-like isoform X1 [Varroa jacobsoni]|uniref:E3 ubiquitin-protein ligase n=1 Tax=Varroa destructor TaxID=109461 RepID=A0A7M7M560_VARDE|nr:E3 ubiquitin-protein ligase UBR2-like isoform X1 [Varroa destructor]XP_022697106.1 E3 ubiquitin-protein ligase UBR2-like isoform X1 [Varroa jacobsoni]
MVNPDESIDGRVAGGGLREDWEAWSKKFEDGQLTNSDFRSYWAQHVPRLFAIGPQDSCLNPRFNEQEINYTFFHSLEKFITNSLDPEQVIKQLKQKESPASFCGHVFKSGEPTYSCRDCGVDPTCVLCATCFKGSEHKQHKYKMNMSRGGGYCDCGDREAWKRSPSCDTHDKEAADREKEDIVPHDMQARLRLVTESVLTYGYQLLTWNKHTQLPTDLEVALPGGQRKDLYVTMLYNDETHTYEQVITSLSRAIEANEREAVEFATTVDREGRAMIKIDGFQECTQVKHAVERTTSRHGGKPLKTIVMTTPLVSHQIFVSRLVQWMDTFIKQLRGFARILGNVLITVPTSPIDIYPLVRCVMRHDTQLWKSARQLWHQLIINGILMDPEWKLAFAKMYARDYPDLMKDFIADDHDHSFSVMSLTVQVFSVVSVAHSLIAEDGALATLMRTFLSECSPHKSASTGKLAFDRNHSNTNFRRSFRRAQFILFDLKYLLYVQPTPPWSEELRKSFSNGLETVLQLLSMMHCMDAVTRQVGQHVEFEAEWETGINIQLKLSTIVSMLLEWCENDRDMLIRAVRRTLCHLIQSDKSCCNSEVVYVQRSIACHPGEVTCIDYDVTTQPISVHLALSRFLSGLLLATHKYSLDYSSHQFEVENKPSLIQIMEQPLRLQVMVAQFRASMWRRNGYSLLNQVFFYTNFRLRTETFDRDIALLQYCAARLEPNELLIHFLNRFDLLQWFSNLDYSLTNLEGTPDTSATLCDDFLTLILYLIAERHLPGVGQVNETERVKQEIIQLLCIEPFPHSQLVKQVPARYDDSAMEIILEKVLREVAVFKRTATVGSVGKYELKPEYYKFFNPFFYHYSREEQSKAEESQLKRRKAAGEPGFCPPPVLPNFTKEFKPILNILDCNTFGHIVNTILHRCATGSTVFTDAQMERVLHLVIIGLEEVARGTLPATFSTRMSSLKDNFERAYPKLEENSAVKALMAYVIKRLNTPISGDCCDSTMAEAESSVSSSSRTKRGRNAEAAAARRAKILAQMCAQQSHFVKEYAHMFELAETADEVKEDVPKFICILCREEEVVSSQAKQSLVVSAFVQKSAVLQKCARDNPAESVIFSAPLAMGLPPSDLRGGAHMSTCGHVMHWDCWEAFYHLVQTKERRRPVRYGRHVSFDVSQGEFLCPLCECLSNSVIPIVPCQKDETKIDPIAEQTLSEWLDSVRSIADSATPMGIDVGCEEPSSLPVSPRRLDGNPAENPAQEAVDENQERAPTASSAEQALRNKLWVPPGGVRTDQSSIQLPPKAESMLQRFVSTTSQVVLGDEEDAFLAVTWTLAYTIQATEWCIRSEDKALLADISSRKLYCLENMIKATQVASVLGIIKSSNVASDALQALRCILLPQTEVDSCILEIDPFGLLCMLHSSLHKVTNSDAFTLNKNLLSLVMTMHIVQIVISLYLQKDKQADEATTSTSSTGTNSTTSTNIEMGDFPATSAGAPALTGSFDADRINEFAGEVLLAAGLSANHRFPPAIRVIEALVPFLRATAILQYFVSPRDCDGRMRNNKLNDPVSLTQFIGISVGHIEAMLRCRPLRELALSWARQPKVLHLATSHWKPIYPLKVNSLIQLPNDYSELINYVALLTCPSSEGEINILGDEVRAPTMCLVCGAVLCSQSYCCQTMWGNQRVGACVAHAAKCASGVGVFLKIKDCRVMLLVGDSKGAFSSPPYVDEYGETDPGLLRGNPLTLCNSAYTQLNQLWLSHSVPEQVAHALEASTSLSSTNWALM